MPIPDTFAYTARWDSVGLDCTYCSHFVGPSAWPDEARVSKCVLHDVSLAVKLGESGFKEWEWFCKEFTWNGDDRASKAARIEFERVKATLSSEVLYRLYGEKNELIEYPFSDLARRGG